MKIAIDIRSLMNSQYSGVGWYVFNLLSALFAADRDNEYLLFYNSNKAVDLPNFAGDNVRLQPYNWSNKLLNLSLLLFNRPRLDRLAGGEKKVQIFFAPNLNFIAWSKGVKKILVVHDLSFILRPDFFTWQQRLWHELIMQQEIIAQADLIIAVSENTKRDLIDLLAVPAEKIRVIYEGAPAAAGQLDDKSLKQRYQLPERYFLFLGTNEPRKNLSGVCRALEKLPEKYHLVVVGPKGWKVETEKIISRDLQSRVRSLAYVSEADKAGLYKNAIALVYPSFYEGFGLPILEAMTHGCPVIAGNNSSQGEVLGEAGLLVDPFNAADIGRGMEIMATDENLRQKCIAAGLKQAEKFSWQKAAEELLTVFETFK